MSVRVERLAAEHIDRILEIENRVQVIPWSRRSFENELTNPHAIFLVALSGANLVGYGGIWNVIDEAHVTTIMVAPESRRAGIGRSITKSLLLEALECGMTCATLEVRVSNESAISLYQGLGFEKVAVRKDYYPDNHEDAWIMWLYDLRGRAKDWA